MIAWDSGHLYEHFSLLPLHWCKAWGVTQLPTLSQPLRVNSGANLVITCLSFRAWPTLSATELRAKMGLSQYFHYHAQNRPGKKWEDDHKQQNSALYLQMIKTRQGLFFFPPQMLLMYLSAILDAKLTTVWRTSTLQNCYSGAAAASAGGPSISHQCCSRLLDSKWWALEAPVKTKRDAGKVKGDSRLGKREFCLPNSNGGWSSIRTDKNKACKH